MCWSFWQPAPILKLPRCPQPPGISLTHKEKPYHPRDSEGLRRSCVRNYGLRPDIINDAHIISGNNKTFRSSVSGTEYKDQVYISSSITVSQKHTNSFKSPRESGGCKPSKWPQTHQSRTQRELSLKEYKKLQPHQQKKKRSWRKMYNLLRDQVLFPMEITFKAPEPRSCSLLMSWRTAT